MQRHNPVDYRTTGPFCGDDYTNALLKPVFAITRVSHIKVVAICGAQG